MPRAIRCICFLFLAATAAATAQEKAGRDHATAEWRLRLTEAIQRAVAQNPRVTEAGARARAARDRSRQAGTLPDPEVEFGLKDAPAVNPSLSRDNFTMEMVTGRQRYPARGKRTAERRSAQAEAEGSTAMLAREKVEIAADTADAFFMLAGTDGEIAILEDTRRTLEDAAASATALYRVGKAGQTDVLRANLERTALDERLSSLRAERRVEAARLNVLQGLPAAATIAPIPTVDPGPGVPAASELARRAEAGSPAVAAAAAEVRRAEQELELARLEGKPDWMLMAYYGHRDRFEDLAGVSAAINLPWAHRGRLAERRAEKEAELAAARARVEAAKNEIRGEIEVAYAELDKNLEQSRLYRNSIVPQAEVSYRSARESYVVGKIDFLTLARAATDLDAYRRESALRVSGIGRALAALQKASGLPLIEGTPASGDADAQK